MERALAEHHVAIETASTRLAPDHRPPMVIMLCPDMLNPEHSKLHEEIIAELLYELS